MADASPSQAQRPEFELAPMPVDLIAAEAAEADADAESTPRRPNPFEVSADNRSKGKGGSCLRCNCVRGAVSLKKRRFLNEKFDLDLTYITDRLIAMGYPSFGCEGCYRNRASDVHRFFENRHRGHYRFYNLCSESTHQYPDGIFLGSVRRFPFPDHNAPPFERMLAFCMDVQSWLAADKRNVAAVHCKAGKGRTGTMIAAMLDFAGLAPGPGASLQQFALRRTYNSKGVMIPSQRRFVYYFGQQVEALRQGRWAAGLRRQLRAAVAGDAGERAASGGDDEAKEPVSTDGVAIPIDQGSAAVAAPVAPAGAATHPAAPNAAASAPEATGAARRPTGPRLIAPPKEPVALDPTPPPAPWDRPAAAAVSRRAALASLRAWSSAVEASMEDDLDAGSTPPPLPPGVRADDLLPIGPYAPGSTAARTPDLPVVLTGLSMTALPVLGGQQAVHCRITGASGTVLLDTQAIAVQAGWKGDLGRGVHDGGLLRQTVAVPSNDRHAKDTLRGGPSQLYAAGPLTGAEAAGGDLPEGDDDDDDDDDEEEEGGAGGGNGGADRGVGNDAAASAGGVAGPAASGPAAADAVAVAARSLQRDVAQTLSAFVTGSGVPEAQHHAAFGDAAFVTAATRAARRVGVQNVPRALEILMYAAMVRNSMSMGRPSVLSTPRSAKRASSGPSSVASEGALPAYTVGRWSFPTAAFDGFVLKGTHKVQLYTAPAPSRDAGVGFVKGKPLCHFWIHSGFLPFPGPIDNRGDSALAQDAAAGCRWQGGPWWVQEAFGARWRDLALRLASIDQRASAEPAAAEVEEVEPAAEEEAEPAAAEEEEAEPAAEEEAEPAAEEEAEPAAAEAAEPAAAEEAEPAAAEGEEAESAAAEEAEPAAAEGEEAEPAAAEEAEVEAKPAVSAAIDAPAAPEPVLPTAEPPRKQELPPHRVGWLHLPKLAIDKARKDKRNLKFPPDFAVTMVYERPDPVLGHLQRPPAWWSDWEALLEEAVAEAEAEAAQ